MIEFFSSPTTQTVLGSLNSGFVVTLELFCITLLGAAPLGLIISFGSMNRWAPFGFIARKLNQVTELGKMLDPLADKLTQGVVALCLAIKFPVICPALLVFILKELVMLCGAILLLKKKKRPCAAQWYGKVATVMFYVSVALIVVMDGFLHVEGVAFQVISYVLLGLTAAMMIYSAVKYAQIFLKILRSDDSQYDLSLTDEIRAKTVRDKRIKS